MPLALIKEKLQKTIDGRKTVSKHSSARGVDCNPNDAPVQEFPPQNNEMTTLRQ